MLHNGQAHKYHLTGYMLNCISDPMYYIPGTVVQLNHDDYEAFGEHWKKVGGSVKGKTTWIKHAYSVAEEHLTNLAKKYYHLTYHDAAKTIDFSHTGIFLKAEILGYKLTAALCDTLSVKINDLLRNNCKKPEEPKYGQKYDELSGDTVNLYGNNFTANGSAFSPEALLRLMGKAKAVPLKLYAEEEEIEEE
jgi:DNA-binding Xre family transcriptional regulator